MIGLRGGLLLMALLAGASVILCNRTLQQQLEVARQHIHEVQLQRDQHQQTANHLQSTLTRQRDSQARLLALHSELRQSLAQRERLIERLKHDNPQLRNWADQPLPDPARRLRERPALSGADAYRQWLSGGDALPTAGDSAKGQRRPAH